MTSLTRRHLGTAAVLGTVGLLAACSGGKGSETGSSDGGGDAATISVTDNSGEQKVATPPASVVATDNRTFETLADWGVTLSAAARSLMPSTNPLADDESIVDLGNHREPDLEAVVAVEPDLIINGQRFTQFHDKFAELAPDATILELDPRDGEPFADELKRQVEVLGEIFGKQDAAKDLSSGLDEAISRATKAYDPSEKVMAVIVSGGEIGYSAPTVGRTLGPLFDMLGLTPALEVAGADDDHQGDDISVEAIADSNPDWILVMDRDAAIASEEDSQPAAEVIEGSEALAHVTAVTEGNVVYMPDDTYTNEGIQTYTEFLGSFAEALESKG